MALLKKYAECKECERPYLPKRFWQKFCCENCQLTNYNRKRNMRDTHCALCGDDNPAHLEYHHLIPKVLGGTDNEDNILTLCGSCHGKFHAYLRPLSLSSLIREGTVLRNQQPIAEKIIDAENKLQLIQNELDALKINKEELLINVRLNQVSAIENISTTKDKDICNIPMEITVEPIAESIVEPIIEPKVEPVVEPIIEPKVEPIVTILSVTENTDTSVTIESIEKSDISRYYASYGIYSGTKYWGPMPDPINFPLRKS